MELPASSVSLSHVHLVPFGGRPSHRLAFKQSIESIRRCTTLTVPMPHTAGHFTNRLRNGSRRLGCKPGCRERPVAAEKEAPLPPVRCLATHTSKTRPLGKCWAAALLAIGLAASLHQPFAFAQEPAPARQPAQQPQSSMGGISSAGTFAPVYDSEKRPITAGGFVDHSKGTVVFEDATEA